MGSEDLEKNTIDSPLHTIWDRARTREFAHGFACSRFERKARWDHIIEISMAILGLSALVLGLSVTDPGIGDVSEHVFGARIVFLFDRETRPLIEFAGKMLIIFSALISVFSLSITILSRRAEYLMLRGRHEMAQRIYISLAQKTRRMQSGLFDENYYKYLVYFLNDYLETIPPAGDDPSDADYKNAHKRMNKVKSGGDDAASLAFVPQIPGEDPAIEEIIKSWESGREDSSREESGGFWSIFSRFLRKD